MNSPNQPRSAPDAQLPLISIIIPAFNVARYLEACLHSVFREIDAARPLARADFEVIVVDDCSSDATPELARRLLEARQDARIATHAANRGLAAARNTGIDSSRGDYLLFLDSDNTLLQGALPRILDAMHANVDADVLILGMDLIDVGGARVGVFYGDRAPPDPLGFLEKHPFRLLGGNLMDNFAVIRASTARMARYDDSLRRLEDWDLWMRLRYEHKCKFAMLNDPVGGYRIRPGQLTEEHHAQNKSFVATTLQIHAKSLAMATRLDLPAPVVQNLLAFLQNAGVAYLRIQGVAQAADPARAQQPAPSSRPAPVELATTQLSFGDRKIPFAFRAGSVADRTVISRVYQSDDFNLATSAEGRRFLTYYITHIGKRPGLIIDAGATIGAAAVYFLELFKDSLTYAIEPDSENFEILNLNTRAYRNRTTRHAAVSAADGELYREDPASSAWRFRATTEASANDPGIRIPAISVPSLLREAGAAVPMIFTCSIQTHDDSLFSADTAWMRSFPVVIMQLHDQTLPLPESSASLARAIADADFEPVHKGKNLFLFNRRLLAGGESNG